MSHASQIISSSRIISECQQRQNSSWNSASQPPTPPRQAVSDTYVSDRISEFKKMRTVVGKIVSLCHTVFSQLQTQKTNWKNVHSILFGIAQVKIIRVTVINKYLV